MPNDPALKIPHMGWNMVAKERDHPILADIRESNLAFYFVHSFAMRCNNSGDVVGLAQYGQPVTAIIAKDNIAATQFHPEKSQDSGSNWSAIFSAGIRKAERFHAKWTPVRVKKTRQIKN